MQLSTEYAFDERLGPVAVMHIPIDDQHPSGSTPLRRPRRDDDVPQQAEAHRPVRQRVVTRRAHRRECRGPREG